MSLLVKLLQPRLLIILVVVVCFSPAFFIGCFSENTTSSSTTISLIIGNGKLQGEGTVKASQDKTVTFNINSDQTGTLHIHGYNIEKHIEANNNATFTMETSATGRFMIAFHSEITESATEHDHDDKNQDHGDAVELELGYLEVVPN